MKQNNCVKLGDYPKWIAKLIKWALDKRKPKGVRVVLYGRGKGSCKGRHNYGSYPLRLCPRAVIYVYFIDKSVENREIFLDEYRKKNQELRTEIDILRDNMSAGHGRKEV